MRPSRVRYGLVAAVVALLGGCTEQTGDTATVQPLETRCGWLSNPTPGNLWLYDGEGEWTIGVQGGYQVEGDWGWPEFTEQQWVRTNVNYGYGCACLQLRVDRRTQEVTEIQDAQARPLAACRRDDSLRRWDPLLE